MKDFFTSIVLVFLIIQANYIHASFIEERKFNHIKHISELQGSDEEYRKGRFESIRIEDKKLYSKLYDFVAKNIKKIKNPDEKETYFKITRIYKIERDLSLDSKKEKVTVHSTSIDGNIEFTWKAYPSVHYIYDYNKKELKEIFTINTEEAINTLFYMYFDQENYMSLSKYKIEESLTKWPNKKSIKQVSIKT